MNKILFSLLVFLYFQTGFADTPFQKLQQLYQKKQWFLLFQKTQNGSWQTAIEQAAGLFFMAESAKHLKYYHTSQRTLKLAQKQFSQYQNFWLWNLAKLYQQSKQYHEWAKTIDHFSKQKLSASEWEQFAKDLKVSCQHISCVAISSALGRLMQQSKFPANQDARLIAIYIKSVSNPSQQFIKTWTLQQWVYPQSLKQAVQLVPKQKIQEKQYFQRLKSLSKLNALPLLLKEAPLFVKQVSSPKIRHSIGKLYLNTLFRTKDYQTLLKLSSSSKFQKTYQMRGDQMLFWKMRSQQRLGRITISASTVNELAKQFPSSPLLAQSYFQVAENFREIKKFQQASQYYRRLLQKYSQTKYATIALWKQGQIAYRQKQYQHAADLFIKATKWSRHQETQAKALYWYAKALLFDQQRIASGHAIQKLWQQYPNTFYGIYSLKWVRSWRLDSKWKQPPQLEPITSRPKGQPLQSSVFQTSQFFLSILQKQWTPSQAQISVQSLNPLARLDYAKFLLQSKNYHELVKLSEKYYKPLMTKAPTKNQDLWNLIYPQAYWNLVKQSSQKVKIDPYWTLAIMREESHFDEQATSVAYAYGLMQLLDSTAKETARQAKIKYRGIDDLMNAEINIALGTAYLGRVKQYFSKKKTIANQLIYATGSYNAGLSNMKKWIKKYSSLPQDEFIERIPFNETRFYIKKVLRSYQMYHRIDKF